jgi:hypothetical protein
VAGALALLPRLRAIVIACRRGSLPAGWKAALELIGIGTRLAIPPGETLDDAQAAALRSDLEPLGQLTRATTRTHYPSRPRSPKPR